MFRRVFSFVTPRKGRGRPAEVAPSSWLKPEAKAAIGGVLLVLFSIIALLSFFHLAGPVGEAILRGLRLSFGFIAYLVPLVLLIVGFRFVWPSLYSWDTWRTVGIVLALIGLVGIFHMVNVPLDTALQVATDGKGGGYTGFLVSYPLRWALSTVAATLIFVASLVIGLLLTFNTSPMDLWAMIMPRRESEEEEGEEGAPDTPRFKVNTMTPETPKPNVALIRTQEQQKKREDDQKAKARAVLKSANRRYKAPPLDLLHTSVSRPDSGNIKENALKIKRTLEQFGIPVTMGEVNVGPTVTQYTLRPDEGIKLSRITALQNDLSLALAAHPLRIEAPIPKKNLVGIEIPNKEVSIVRLRDLLASKPFRRGESPLTFALGKDVSGDTIVDTLEKMPHLLIAGATGSGKSVCINTVLLSWLYRNSPDVMRLILVDPKRVELIAYDGLPHLLAPVIIEPEKTINALKWALREMDRRYRVLSESRSRNLVSYNANHPDQALPYIVIVIDELADLMIKYGRDLEAAIVRLSQMARAVGIHLVLATQRPSVNVITGLIKANIPARIAFQVASQVDSRTILDGAGAEKLLGSGDMLFLSGEMGAPRRIQGGYVSEEEVHRVVETIKENSEEVQYDEEITTPARGLMGSTGDSGDDDLFEEAKNVVIQSRKASASLLQRRLRVGYARAARLLDMLQEQGVIAQGEGNKPREVLIKAEDHTDMHAETAHEDDVEDDSPESDDDGQRSF